MGEPKVYTAEELLSSPQTFDFIIVGGGTAGLVVAARLTENPNVSVLVLEAGDAKINDQKIMMPVGFAQSIGDPEYDWMFTSVPQQGGRVLALPRGKVLGGSSAINFCFWNYPVKADFDHWVELGFEGWSWNDMQPYFKKMETFELPRKEGDRKVDKDMAYDADIHGTEGPIHTSFASHKIPAVEAYFESAAKALPHIGRAREPWSGDHRGMYRGLSTTDTVHGPGTRSYATTGYFLPNAHRPNLKVVCNALVTKVLIDSSQETPFAYGVQILSNGTIYTVKASKEVILSAGAYKTPQVLELSGIGNPAILQRYNIPVVLPNSLVGENTKDHVVSGIMVDTVPGVFSLDRLSDPDVLQEAIQEYSSLRGGVLSYICDGFGFLSYADMTTQEEFEKTIAKAEAGSANVPAHYKARREILIKELKNKHSSGFLTVFIPCNHDPTRGDDHKVYFGAVPGKNRLTVGSAVQYPFSCGSVHITSSSPEKQPAIDPAFGKDPVDMDMLVKLVQCDNRIATTPPLSDMIAGRAYPPPEVDINDDEALAKWIEQSCHTEYHPIGGACIGDVVDARLKVMGIRALRIVDASIIPLPPSANTGSFVYAVAERASDLIKEDWSL